MNELKSILTKEYGKLPVWAWGLVALGGIGIGLYFYKKANSSKTSASTTVGQATGSADTSLLSGSTGMGDYQATGGNANTPGQTVINVGGPTNPSNWLTTLYLTNNGPIPMYDQAGSAGDTHLGNQIATIPGGSTITATGPEIVGAWLSNNTTELWYPVTYQGQSGYISAYYVANASSQITGNPVFPPNPNPNPTHAPGTTFLGPSGVKHYVAMDGDTLTTIAKKFKLSSWNDLYKIPDNQKVLGKLNSSQAASNKIPSGTVLTLPGSVTI